MATSQKRPPLGEVWMILTDHKKLAKLMVIQGVSQRTLAEAAGYRSHAYLGRLLRGEVRTLEPEAAVRIAHYLGVGTDDLFMARSTNAVGRPAHRGCAA